MGRQDRRHLRTIGIAVIILIVLTGSLWYVFKLRADSKDGLAKEDADTSVTAAGMTSAGMDTVTFAVDFLEETSLVIEEILLEEGDTAAAGEAYITFTEESVDRARGELEKALQSAEIACRTRSVANGEEKIQAQYTYDMAVLEADCAPQVYQDTLTQLEMQSVKAQKAYERAQQIYDAYYSAVENNTFYEDYQIEALKKAYDDAYDLFASRRDYWEVTQEELEWQAEYDSKTGAYPNQDDRQWIVRTTALLKDEMTEAKREYDQAMQLYQQEIEGAERKLHRLLNQLETAQQDYTDAQIMCQTGSFRAKTVYELTIAKGQTAQSDYNVCLLNCADALERLDDAKIQAADNLAMFEALVGDGCLYTERAGTISRILVQEGQVLAGGEPLLVYANSGEAYVSVVVSETDSVKLSVGEQADVTVAGCGSFDGIVKSIQPVSLTDGKMSVCSAVTVSLEGDVSAIDSNQKATVVFKENRAVACNAPGGTDAGSGHVEQMYDVDIKDTGYLEVEDVYVKAGQHIREGDPVCRFTQDSIARVRKALVHAQSEAQAALVKEQAKYHLGVLEAGLSHNEAMLGKTLAQTAYENTIARLNTDRVAKILETEQLMADIYQLQLSLTGDGYRSQQADVTRAYENAKKQVEQARECFVTSQVEASRTFQEAKEAYEAFLDQFDASNQLIAEKIEKVSTLQDEILRSQQLMERELLAAEQSRTSALVEGENADAEYAGIVKEYEDALARAQSDLDKAVQKLEEFDRFAGDGTVYATGNGVVAQVGCSKGDRITDIGKLMFFAAEGGDKEETQ